MQKQAHKSSSKKIKKKPVPIKPRLKMVPFPELNKRENKLFYAFADGQPHPIQELKQLFFREALHHIQNDHEAGEYQHELRKQSIVRNSLRRLRDDFKAKGREPGLGWITKVERGIYQVTTLGQKKFNEATGLGAVERRKLLAATSPVVVKGKKLTKKASKK